MGSIQIYHSYIYHISPTQNEIKVLPNRHNSHYMVHINSKKDPCSTCHTCLGFGGKKHKHYIYFDGKGNIPSSHTLKTSTTNGITKFTIRYANIVVLHLYKLSQKMLAYTMSS